MSTIVSIIFSIETATGVITAAMPRIARILKVFEPIAFPTAISSSFLRAAAIEVASSGSEVPQATIVSPISVSVTPNDLAIVTEEFTNNFIFSETAYRSVLITKTDID